MDVGDLTELNKYILHIVNFVSKTKLLAMVIYCGGNRRFESNEECKDQESIRSNAHMTQDTTCKSDKTQESITYKRPKRSALSKQVTTRLQGTDNTV